MRLCKDCGAAFKPFDGRQYRCPRHEGAHRRATNRKAYRRRRGLGLRAGTTGAQRRFVREVFEKKGKTCHWCGKPATTADHFPIAKADGGPDTVENGVPSCGSCNFGRTPKAGS